MSRAAHLSVGALTVLESDNKFNDITVTAHYLLSYINLKNTFKIKLKIAILVK